MSSWEMTNDQGPMPNRRRTGRSGLLLLVVALLLVTGCMTLDQFLFEPTRVDEYFDPDDIKPEWNIRDVIPDSLVEPVELVSSGGNRIYGFFVRPDPDSQRVLENSTTVIYSHGNGENINRYWGRVELLWEAGFRVFIYDYQGYGRSEGSPSGEACFADARAALDYCRSREDVTDSLIAYYGWSLGTWVATYLAADVRHPFGLMLEAPYASTSTLLQEGALLAVPGGTVAEADFDNERRLPLVGCPALIAYGTDDDYAVPERHAERLIEIGERWLDLAVEVVDGAGHSDVPEVMGYDDYRAMVRGFVAACAGDTL